MMEFVMLIPIIGFLVIGFSVIGLLFYLLYSNIRSNKWIQKQPMLGKQSFLYGLKSILLPVFMMFPALIPNGALNFIHTPLVWLTMLVSMFSVIMAIKGIHAGLKETPKSLIGCMGLIISTVTMLIGLLLFIK